MKIAVIDGQGGKMGRLLIETIKKTQPGAEIIAVGTNSMATAAMLKAAPSCAATGENAVIVACRSAEIILGPIGIVIADALYGEITPAMALAVGQSSARKILIPISKCNNYVAGVEDKSAAELIKAAVEALGPAQDAHFPAQS